jgi:hypothetical protein
MRRQHVTACQGLQATYWKAFPVKDIAVLVAPLSNTVPAVQHFGKPCSVQGQPPTPIHRSVTMLLIREVFHCRPGKVRSLLEKFQAMNRIMANVGQGNMRLMTDFSGERYWTLVAEFETPGMAELEKMMQGEGMSEADTKEFERLMEGYHDLIDSGHREIYRLEPATKG